MRAITVTATLLFCTNTWAFLKASQNNQSLTIANNRLVASVSKSKGYINVLTLDGQNLLGTESGNTGVGPYLDCYCTPSGFWTPGRGKDVHYQLFNGTDSTGTPYGGISMGETYAPTGQRLEQYWFLREGETGLHTFSRIVYHNETTPFLRNLQEFRTLFRPNHDPPLFTHFITNDKFSAPRPDQNGQVVVQDATWQLVNKDDPYVKGVGDYFTKYTFQDSWRNHLAHGMYADGRTTNGTTYGAWLVHNTVETYFGGPTHSDLVVDGIVYNYMVSNHHGAQTPNITNGFDRTFGPQYFHFNTGGTLSELRKDAEQYGQRPDWNAPFYDSIAAHVPNLITSSARGTFSANIALPTGAQNPIAILTTTGHNYQDNAANSTAYQYWTPIPSTGTISIPRVKPGSYRLTLSASSIFGDYTHDSLLISASQTTSLNITWTPESAGKELFRIGTPDKSSGEFLHGTAPSPTHPLLTEEYRLYWAAYDFIRDFPTGIHFRVGKDDPAQALNYVHWAVFGGKANSLRPVPVPDHVYDWSIRFDVEEGDVKESGKATFTVQLAGAKTAAGNTDLDTGERWANLPLRVMVNGEVLEDWVIPYYQSSSCAVRSAVSCYHLAHKFVFSGDLLKEGENEIVLALPYNATGNESAVLPEAVYVQYDALRLEVE
ncbi:polysaccharide lyase family 4 protein [Bipolaris victoriae FI3]|uniref:rhamnogalacturonan endolyase n=1 Tax=Bipolaris victoriae (strain FI3) TaxID=930091 RepID=W7F0X7_BIPV3|nr:polysaccharide lyase family 4 protein [Bipolaris victoriae FI3]